MERPLSITKLARKSLLLNLLVKTAFSFLIDPQGFDFANYVIVHYKISFHKNIDRKSYHTTLSRCVA